MKDICFFSHFPSERFSLTDRVANSCGIRSSARGNQLTATQSISSSRREISTCESVSVKEISCQFFLSTYRRDRSVTFDLPTLCEMGDEGGIQSGYGDLHRLVLQGMMSAGFLDAKGVKNLFYTACQQLHLDAEPRTTMHAIQNAVRQINEKIKDFDMVIKSASCEITGKKFYIFLVTIEKPIMRMQTMFNKSECELFQKIMTNVLAMSDNFAIPVSDCLNMAKELDTTPKLTLETAEAYLERMALMQYFAKVYSDPSDPEYEITIGIRTIREFEPILREIYNDVVTNCNLCKMIMLHGLQCHRCSLPVHKACGEKYVKNPEKLPCPNCKTPWKSDLTNMVKRSRASLVRHSESEANDAASTQ